jgi:large subunit ribosomal protein L20
VNAVASRARRKKMMKLAKGYWGRGKNVWTVAKNKIEKGLTYAYRDRKNKKREFRALWIQRINAGVREHGMSYSVFMGKMANAGIELNRKVLADLAMNHPEAFKAVIDTVANSNGQAKVAPVAAPKAAKPAAPVAPAPQPAAKADDLVIIEGIGPKIAELLKNAGISTFAQLAETPAARIEEIMDAAGSRFRVHDATTWPQQAALARDGKMDELKALQDSLNAGKTEVAENAE